MLRSPVALLRTLPPVVRVLVAGTFVNKLGSFILPYLTIVLRREFRLEETQVAGLLLAYGAGSLISVLAGGFFTDRLGRRFTLLLSLLGSGAIAVVLGFAPSIRVFAPLLVALGFVADLYRPAATAIIGDLLPSSQRATGFAALRMAINLGFAVGMTLGGLVADWSWRWLFFGDGATTLVYGLVVYRFIPETRPAEPHAGERPGSTRVWPWKDTVYLQVMMVSFAFALVFFCHITTLPLTITGTAGYPARLFGMIVAVNGLLIAAFEISVVHRVGTFRRLRVAALGLTLTGLGFAVTASFLHWSWFLVTVVLWTVGEILTTPLMAFVTDWAPPSWRGRYLSWFQATWSLALAVNPILFLPLQARVGDRLFWPLMLIIVMPGVLVLLRLDRVADRPERLRGLSIEGTQPAVLSPGAALG